MVGLLSIGAERPYFLNPTTGRDCLTPRLPSKCLKGSGSKGNFFSVKGGN